MAVFWGVGALGMHPVRPPPYACKHAERTRGGRGGCGRMETPQRGGDKPRPPLISRMNFENYQNPKKIIVTFQRLLIFVFRKTLS